MPATTGVSMAPAARPDVQLHAGVVPGYYLSNATQQDEESASLHELGGVIEPDHWLELPGLIVGARYAGEPASGAAVEPLLGYRAALGAERRWGLGVIAFGTHADASRKHASFSATRAGAEGGADVRLTPSSQWFELHLAGSVALTGLSASGAYCLDAGGQYGVDCPDEGAVLSNAKVSGVYPSANAGLALEIAQHLDSAFHGGRIALSAGGGTMPTVVAASQQSARAYAALGLTLTLGFGAAH